MARPDADPARPGAPGPTGEVDANGPIWKRGAFRRDPWQPAPAAAEIGGELGGAPLLIDKQRWVTERETLASRPVLLGLRLEGGESLEDIADDLGRFALIALNFVKFTDGRGFSTARLLREKFGYAGELRAIGNVLSDQIPFMRRVGFDAFEVQHAPTRRALREDRIPEVGLHYQPVGSSPGGQRRAWLGHRRG